MPRIVSLDVGDATIGVAVSDELNITANPVCTIRRGRSIKADLREVEELLAEPGAEMVVVGLPLTVDGEEGPQAAKVKDFAERLVRRIRIPMEFWDERFSTQEAEEALIDSDVSRAKRRKVIDQAAAVVILVEYMRAKESNEALRNAFAECQKRPQSRHSERSEESATRYFGKPFSQTDVSLCGETTITRSYYHCSSCGTSYVPLDATLGLDSGCTSVGVRTKVGRLAAMIPFENVSLELRELCGIVLSGDTALRIAESMGKRIKNERQEREQAVLSGDVEAPEVAPERLYIGIDGAHVPMHDGSYHEAKCGIVYQTVAGGRQDQDQQRQVYGNP